MRVYAYRLRIRLCPTLGQLEYNRIGKPLSAQALQDVRQDPVHLIQGADVVVAFQ